MPVYVVDAAVGAIAKLTHVVLAVTRLISVLVWSLRIKVAWFEEEMLNPEAHNRS